MPYFTAVVSSARYWPKPPSPVTATIGPVGCRRPGAHRGGVAEADRAEVAGHQHRLARRTRSSGRTSRRGCRRRRRSRRRSGTCSAERREHRGARSRPGRGRRRARRAFSARQIAHRSATSARWSTALRRRQPFEAAAASGDADVAEHGARSTGWKRPIAHRGRRRSARSACTARCRCGWRTTRRPRGAGRTRSSASSRPACRCGRARRAPSGWVSGDQALGLERGQHRRAEPLGQRDAPRRLSPRAPWPTTITGRRASRDRVDARRRAPRPAARSAGRPADRPAGRPRPSRPGRTCTSSGSTRCATPRPSTACFTASVGELGVVGAGVHGRRWTRRRRGTRPDRSTSWNAPRPSTFDGTWPEIASTGARSSLAS